MKSLVQKLDAGIKRQHTKSAEGNIRCNKISKEFNAIKIHDILDSATSTTKRSTKLSQNYCVTAVTYMSHAYAQHMLMAIYGLAD